MITLLTGKKGSGKTKKLIDLANAAVEKSNGNVVVVEKGLKLTYDISHAARLVVWHLRRQLRRDRHLCGLHPEDHRHRR